MSKSTNPENDPNAPDEKHIQVELHQPHDTARFQLALGQASNPQLLRFKNSRDATARQLLAVNVELQERKNSSSSLRASAPSRENKKPSGRPAAVSDPKSLKIVAPDKFDDAQLGAQLTEQYEKATGGMKAIFVFGAMMLVVRDTLSTRGQGSGNGVKGDGLKGWLDEHAPTVHRATAYRFMTLAEGLRDEFRLGNKCDIVHLLTAPAEELPAGQQATRKKIEAFVEGKSQRQLMFEFGYGDSKKKGGKQTPSADPAAPLTPEQEATESYEAIVRSLDGFLAENFHTLLTKDQRTQFAAALAETRRKVEAVK